MPGFPGIEIGTDYSLGKTYLTGGQVLEQLGVLVIHGITANPLTVNSVEKPLNDLGLPVCIPVLKGHGTGNPENLKGVGWEDWVQDAEMAMEALLKVVDKVVLIGHSMGGLISILLASKYGRQIDSIVLVAAAIEPASPFAPGKPLGFVAPVAAKFLKRWKFKPLYKDKRYASGHPNYLWVPIESIKALLALTQKANSMLIEVNMPALILQSRGDTRISKRCAEIIYTSISTAPAEKSIVWFEKTDHEMFLDLEKNEVCKVITGFVAERRSTLSSV